MTERELLAVQVEVDNIASLRGRLVVVVVAVVALVVAVAMPVRQVAAALIERAMVAVFCLRRTTAHPFCSLVGAGVRVHEKALPRTAVVAPVVGLW